MGVTGVQTCALPIYVLHIAGYRVTRRKLGLGPPQLPEWHITLEFQNMAQMDDAFGRVSSRVDPVESFHHSVNSKVQDIFFALYRDFPDANRVAGQEKFYRGSSP